MARRSVPPPKPKPPVLTVGQKRRRIERLQKCMQRLEAFDPQKVQRRLGVPEVAKSAMYSRACAGVGSTRC